MTGPDVAVPGEGPGEPVAPRTGHDAVSASWRLERARVAALDAEHAELAVKAKACGFLLHVIDIGGAAVYILARWGRTMELPDLQAVEAFLDRVERRP